jgi:hypothetical protein
VISSHFAQSVRKKGEGGSSAVEQVFNFIKNCFDLVWSSRRLPHEIKIMNSSQLIQPSTYRPWSVEIVSAVPKYILYTDDDVDEPRKKKKRMTTFLDESNVTTGAVCLGWACVGSSKGALYVWPTSSNSSSTTTRSSVASPAPTAGGKPKVDAPESFVTLTHPSLTPTPGGAPNLVALAKAGPDVFVYAAQPAKGNIVVWKVTQGDVRNVAAKAPRISNYAMTKVKFVDDDDDDEDNDNKDPEEAEAFTSLTVIDSHMIVLGTNKGGMICCTQTTIPVSLYAQRIVPHNRNSRRSLMGLLFKSSASGAGDDASDDAASSINFQLPLAASHEQEESKSFLTISQRGSIWLWKILPTVAATHKVTTEARCIASLRTLLRENHPHSSASLDYVDPLQAQLVEGRLHLLVRTYHGTLDSDTGECRLYWIRLRLDTTSSKVKAVWVDAQWLNRFPAPQDVKVMGLVLAKEMAYAAFHQGSGGVTSSVIVMAMSDSLNDSEDEDQDGERTIYEVDLPMTEVPALLPNTFTNDHVTYGCFVFSRSGLGIRVRVLPPSSMGVIFLQSRGTGQPEGCHQAHYTCTGRLLASLSASRQYI